MKKILSILFVLSIGFISAQEKYAEGYFEIQVVNEEFFDTKILTDSDRNKDVIAENMTYYNRMVKAYNAKEYKEAKKWAEEAFWGSIGEKIQFKVYQKKFDYVNELMQNQKLILFVALCNTDARTAEIQEVFDYCKNGFLSPSRMEFVEERAKLYNETAKKKIILEKEYSYE